MSYVKLYYWYVKHIVNIVARDVVLTIVSILTL